LSDPEYDPDYVVAFIHAEEDEIAAADAERQTTAGGCLSTATIMLAVVIVLTFSLS
jgi:hypothetical protein